MDFVNYLDYVTWVPLVLWVGLFFWFLLVSYPLYLKRMANKGLKWAYVPEKYAKKYSNIGVLRANTILLTILASLLSSCSVIWLVGKFTNYPPVYGLASFILFIIVGVVLYKKAMKMVNGYFQAAYYFEYCKVRYASDIKGNSRNEADLINRTVWSFTRKLLNAERHHRFRKYVMAMAKSKKLPPDIYAETMNVF